MSSRTKTYRCFHCQDMFHGVDAALHFGHRDGDIPACLMQQPGEHHLLKALRTAHDELAAYRAEDTELMRAMHSMSADHSVALRREEERGYSKGVADRTHEFKNFHRLLCERFNYEHDDLDWQRDQISLIEWIATKYAVNQNGDAK